MDENKRIRYKRCLDCGCKFKTEQLITEELIVPKRVRGGGGGKRAKLTEGDVLFIRKQLTEGMFTPGQLAMQYEVGVSCISKIQSGRIWNC